MSCGDNRHSVQGTARPDSATGWSIGIGLTTDCNMACPFCYSKGLRHGQEVPLAAWRSFFDRWHARIESVNYGTGENTLNADWFELVGYVRSRYPRIRQALTTNGHLITAVEDAQRRRLFDIGIDEVDISLDFADERRHCFWRGTADAYQDALRSLDWCCGRRKDTTLVLLGLNETLEPENLEGIFGLAARAGANVRINLYRPVNPVTGLLPPSLESVLVALDWIARRHTVVAITDRTFAALYCMDGPVAVSESSMRILPSGHITPSTYLITPEWIAGHIDDEDVLERLAGSAPFRRLHDSPLPEACCACPLRVSCRGGSADSRILHYGTLEERSPYCPARHGMVPGVRLLPLSPSAEPPGMHARYLPTMIFRPGKGGGGGD